MSGIETKASRPVLEAQRILKELYNEQSKSGRPDFERFYPVNLDLIVSILGWQIERVSMVGLADSGDPVDALADFQNKRIQVGIDESAGGRINFSLAHEIGHIVLHGAKGVRELLRTRSVRPREPSVRQHPYEIEANRFAAELLMPPKAVRHRFQKLFNCSEISVSSQQAEQIHRSQNHRKGSEPLTKSALSFAISTYRPDQERVPLVRFFNVTPSAMARRLVELMLVLD